MRNTPVCDKCSLNSQFDRIGSISHFWNHTPSNRLVLDQSINIITSQTLHQLHLLIQNPSNVRQEQHSCSLELSRNPPSSHIGIDIVNNRRILCSLDAHTNRCNHRSDTLIQQLVDQLSIDYFDLSHISQIQRSIIATPQLFTLQQPIIPSTQPKRPPASQHNSSRNTLIHIPAQNHGSYIHHLLGTNSHPTLEPAFHAHLLQHGINHWSTSVNYHDAHAEFLKRGNVLAEAVGQFGCGHGVSTVFDDYRLAV
mmetsp:Transcript_10787/g.23721  ORF Transcript_10787/g.23721 Transcript_10787/m.23721 type:complete len:253 (-) Transcript_10787:257-1015(-)